ncbi:unnamed protein product [Cuscuta epithymum]|uniref:Uncharacterized protein n=1 Tax=Cuscuta epithymum TaxID=186058 RepID=A0AAV0CXX2_9ASTE|nr:unnamed protein product [Cuscuta epithymum]
MAQNLKIRLQQLEIDYIRVRRWRAWKLAPIANQISTISGMATEEAFSINWLGTSDISLCVTLDKISQVYIAKNNCLQGEEKAPADFSCSSDEDDGDHHHGDYKGKRKMIIVSDDEDDEEAVNFRKAIKISKLDLFRGARGTSNQLQQEEASTAMQHQNEDYSVTIQLDDQAAESEEKVGGSQATSPILDEHPACLQPCALKEELLQEIRASEKRMLTHAAAQQEASQKALLGKLINIDQLLQQVKSQQEAFATTQKLQEEHLLQLQQIHKEKMLPEFKTIDAAIIKGMIWLAGQFYDAHQGRQMPAKLSREYQQHLDAGNITNMNNRLAELNEARRRAREAKMSQQQPPAAHQPTPQMPPAHEPQPEPQNQLSTQALSQLQDAYTKLERQLKEDTLRLSHGLLLMKQTHDEDTEKLHKTHQGMQNVIELLYASSKDAFTQQTNAITDLAKTVDKTSIKLSSKEEDIISLRNELTELQNRVAIIATEVTPNDAKKREAYKKEHG